MRATPSGAALKAGAVHQSTAASLAAIRTTGVRRGIYRFRSDEEANTHAEEALARAMAANLLARKLI
jgi:hypothetical protein